jgi:hypothetical protein
MKVYFGHAASSEVVVREAGHSLSSAFGQKFNRRVGGIHESVILNVGIEKGAGLSGFEFFFWSTDCLPSFHHSLWGAGKRKAGIKERNFNHQTKVWSMTLHEIEAIGQG